MQNSTSELTAIGTRLTSLTGTEATEEKAGVPGLPELVADMHKIVAEQKRQRESEGPVGARLDSLLKMMGDEKERHAGQHTSESRFRAFWAVLMCSGGADLCYAGQAASR